MQADKTAIIMIGFQNDYFADDGILRKVVEASSRVSGVLDNTLHLLQKLRDTPVLFISTPIIFTPDYSELVDPVGILKTIKELGAFRQGASGSKTIDMVKQFGERIIEVPGKRGLNAFSNTNLESVLQENGITDVVLVGTVVSICIDSTGRAAFEQGYKVTVLSDCTSGRTVVEQDFYCEQLLPIYAQVINHHQLLNELLAQ